MKPHTCLHLSVVISSWIVMTLWIALIGTKSTPKVRIHAINKYDLKVIWVQLHVQPSQGSGSPDVIRGWFHSDLQDFGSMSILYISVLLLCRYLPRGGLWLDCHEHLLAGDENPNSTYTLQYHWSHVKYIKVWSNKRDEKIISTIIQVEESCLYVI